MTASVADKPADVAGPLAVFGRRVVRVGGDGAEGHTAACVVVVARLRDTLNKKSFKLVEALAEHLCQLIITEFKAPWVKIKVAKPGILPGVKSLGVVIERGTKPA